MTLVRTALVSSLAASLATGAFAQLAKSNPPGVAAPIVPEYSHVVVVPGGSKLLYLSGQLGIRPDGSLPKTFDDQMVQAYENVRTILASQGATLQDIVKMSIYAVSEPADPKRLGAFRAEFFGTEPRPATTFVYVSRLARPE